MFQVSIALQDARAIIKIEIKANDIKLLKKTNNFLPVWPVILFLGKKCLRIIRPIPFILQVTNFTTARLSWIASSLE